MMRREAPKIVASKKMKVYVKLRNKRANFMSVCVCVWLTPSASETPKCRLSIRDLKLLYFVVKHLLCFVVARYYYMPAFCCSFIVVIHCGSSYEIGMENKLSSLKCTKRREMVAEMIITPPPPAMSSVVCCFIGWLNR